MKLRALVLALSLISTGAFAGDIASPSYKAPAYVSTPCTLTSCSGWYAGMGLSGSGTNANIIGNGIQGSVFSAGGDIDIHGGYQLWTGPVLAGLQLNGGYEFSSQGASAPGSHFLGTALMQLGYNFFNTSTPTATAPSAATTPGQSPFQNIVPANLLAASTPYINAGGCIRHGITQGCAGTGIQTVIAAGWSTAFDYVNMPSQKGQPDSQVFLLKVLKHF